jgi:hypothetical protein
MFSQHSRDSHIQQTVLQEGPAGLLRLPGRFHQKGKVSVIVRAKEYFGIYSLVHVKNILGLRLAGYAKRQRSPEPMFQPI